LLAVGLWVLFLVEGYDIVVGPDVSSIGAKLLAEPLEVYVSALKHGPEAMIEVTPVDEYRYSVRGVHVQAGEMKQGVRKPNPLELIRPPLMLSRAGR